MSSITMYLFYNTKKLLQCDSHCCLLMFGDNSVYHVSPPNHIDLLSAIIGSPYPLHQREVILCQDPSLASHLSKIANWLLWSVWWNQRCPQPGAEKGWGGNYLSRPLNGFTYIHLSLEIEISYLCMRFSKWYVRVLTHCIWNTNNHVHTLSSHFFDTPSFLNPLKPIKTTHSSDFTLCNEKKNQIRARWFVRNPYRGRTSWGFKLNILRNHYLLN